MNSILRWSTLRKNRVYGVYVMIIDMACSRTQTYLFFLAEVPRKTEVSLGTRTNGPLSPSGEIGLRIVIECLALTQSTAETSMAAALLKV